jgi:hypothetical protein
VKKSITPVEICLVLLLIVFSGYALYGLLNASNNPEIITKQLPVTQNQYPKVSPTPVATPTPPYSNVELHNIPGTWTNVVFAKAGFSLNIPPSWMLLSTPPSQVQLKESIANSTDPEGEYYNTPTVESFPMFIGPKTILESKNITKDQQELANRTDVVAGYIGYNGMLDELSYLNHEVISTPQKMYSTISYDEDIIYAETNTLIEAYIPLRKRNPNGLEYALILVLRDKTQKPFFDQMLNSSKFVLK